MILFFKKNYLYLTLLLLSKNINMAREKFIKGKHDDGKHDGRFANTKREQEADAQLEGFLFGGKSDTISFYEASLRKNDAEKRGAAHDDPDGGR